MKETGTEKNMKKCTEDCPWSKGKQIGLICLNPDCAVSDLALNAEEKRQKRVVIFHE